MKVKDMGMLLTMLAEWINRHQQDVIECLKQENKILREKLGTGNLRIGVSLVQGSTSQSQVQSWRAGITGDGAVCCGHTAA